MKYLTLILLVGCTGYVLEPPSVTCGLICDASDRDVAAWEIDECSGDVACFCTDREETDEDTD